MPSTDYHLLLLLRACRRGDEAAARSLYALVAPGLKVYARAILKDDALTEDAAQTALCRVFVMDVGAVDAVRDARGWLAAMTRSAALNILRTRRRTGAVERRAAAGRRLRLAGGDEGRTGTEAVGAAVDALPRRLREIIVLKHVGGLTFDQIGEALGLNRNTAAARHRAAVERLRRALASAGLEEVSHA